MIDIHHHCIHGVDDGPRDLADAVAMCRMALDDGIETIVATPHMLRGRWKPCTTAELAQRLSDLQAALGDTPRLLLGAECYFTHDLEDLLDRGLAEPLARSRYVLIEFAAESVPPHVEIPLHRLQLKHRVPIIAHPERNAVFSAHPELLSALVGFGARTQITAGSLLGQFGDGPRRAAESWVREGLVHFVATDAHNLRNRRPLMAEGFERLRQIAGDATARELTFDNPLAVVENRPLPFVPGPSSAPNRGLLRRLKSFLEFK